MRSLSSILDQSAERFGACPCVIIATAPVCLGTEEEDGTSCRVLTYKAAVHVMKQHQEWMQNVLLKNEDSSNMVVAYLSSNSTNMLLSLLACIKSSPTSNVLPAMLNTRWTPAEMAASLEATPDDSSTKTGKTVLLYGPGFRNSAQETVRRLSHNVWAMPLPQFAEAAFETYHQPTTPIPITSMDYDADHLAHRDLWVDEVIRNAIDYSGSDAVIVFTSGTTSGSKGVRLSHKSLYVQAMSKLRNPCAYSQDTRMMATTVPLFHVGGLGSVLAILLAGGCWVFPSSQAKSLPKSQFDPSSVIQSLSHAQLPTNTLVVVPAMLTSILSQIDEDQTYESVRLILIGGQSASDQMVKRLIKVFPHARIVQTYACTEAASSLTYLTVHPQKAVTTITASSGAAPAGDCVGMPPPHVELCLYPQDGPAGGKLTAVHKPYQVGVIATRGPHVMNGYWVRGGTVSQRSHPHDGWFVTNDLGFMDDKGQLYFCGRVKDVIRTGGETVLSSEVERVLLQHKDIAECAVFCLPDEKFGEAVCAALVVSPTTTTKLTLSQVRQFCAQCDLAGYKRPRRIYFIKELPRNSSGKVLKYRLVERFRAKKTMKSKL